MPVVAVPNRRRFYKVHRSSPGSASFSRVISSACRDGAGATAEIRDRARLRVALGELGPHPGKFCISIEKYLICSA